MYDLVWYQTAPSYHNREEHELSLINNAARPDNVSHVSNSNLSQSEAISVFEDVDFMKVASMPALESGAKNEESVGMEDILANKTKRPLSLIDLYKFIEKERAAENIEFYIWFKGYEGGKLTAFPELPVEVNIAIPDAAKLVVCPFDEPGSEASGAVKLEDSDAYKIIAKMLSPLNKQKSHKVSIYPIPCVPLTFKKTITTINEAKAAGLTEEEIERFRRMEIDVIKRVFVSPLGPKSLNVTSRLRKEAMAALETSTAAENLRELSEYVLKTMRNSHHRAFLSQSTAAVGGDLGGCPFQFGSFRFSSPAL